MVEKKLLTLSEVVSRQTHNYDKNELPRNTKSQYANYMCGQLGEWTLDRPIPI